MRIPKGPLPTQLAGRRFTRRLLATLAASLLLAALAVACGGSEPATEQPAAPTLTPAPATTPDAPPTGGGAPTLAPATQPPASATATGSESQSTPAPTPADPPAGPTATAAVEPDPTQPPAPTSAPVPDAPLGSKEGNLAPAFTVTGIDGEVVSLDGLVSQGQPFLLYFFTTW